ncbi:MAG: hypothetical protein RR923_04735 [Bacilli bacterium]
MFSNSLKNYSTSEINNNLNYRTLLIYGNPDIKDYGLELITDTLHVKDVYFSRYDFISSGISNYKNNFYDGKIGLFYGSDNTIPTIKVGRGFDVGETGSAICPQKFYPDSGAWDFRINESKVINGEKLLGKKFNITFENNSSKKKIIKQFKVVGLYDNKSVMHYNNECFIAPEDMVSIVDFVNPLEEGSIDSFLVLIDKISNLEKANNLIKNKLNVEMDVFTRQQLDTKMINQIINSVNIIFLIIVVIIFFTINFYSKKKIIKDEQIIEVLKTNGYENNIIKNIYFLKLLTNVVLSYFVSLIIFLIIFKIMSNTLLNGLINYGIKITLDFNIIFFTFAIFIGITFLNRVYMKIESKKE